MNTTGRAVRAAGRGMVLVAAGAAAMSGSAGCAGSAPVEATPPSGSAAPAASSAPAAMPTTSASAAMPVAPASASATAPVASGSAASGAPEGGARAVRALKLPGAGPDGVVMDYLACDRATGRVWVPAGGTGSVDVIEAGSDAVKRIDGFPTAEVTRNGKKRVQGPSSVTIGEGAVYVGSRADGSVCVVNPKTLARGACLKLSTPPDGLVYVAATKEVWATTPRETSITILDASSPTALKPKGSIKLPGDPEGYAVDEGRGIFYTNLEDKDRTLVIDVRGRKVTSTWTPKCGEEGPRGLALDKGANLLFVACTDRVMTMDAGHDGKVLGQLATGAGVDNLDYLESRRELYVGAAKTGELTVAKVEGSGALSVLTKVKTAEGARNAVVDGSGNVYLTDAHGGQILVVSAGR